MEEIWKKLKTGLKDYCDKNGFSDVVLGLSGGLDSAIVSVLAVDVLGAEHVHCVMMKTQHTSDLSLQIAQELADKNGFDYQILDIEPIIKEYNRDDGGGGLPNYVYNFSEKLKIEPPYNLVIPLLGSYLKKMKTLM